MLALKWLQIHLKGKTPEQIREAFNIECDFTPEELAQVQKENQWADDN